MDSGFDVSPMTASYVPPRYRTPMIGAAEVFRVWLPDDEGQPVGVGHVIYQAPDGLAFLSRIGEDDGDAFVGARLFVTDLIREGFASGASAQETRTRVYTASLVDEHRWEDDLDTFYASIREAWGTS